MSAISEEKCRRCGSALPADAPEGLCPRCLGALSLASETLLSEAGPGAAARALSPEELAPHFPQLEILECLGRGGMGVVYKARQKSLNRVVALKLLAPERVGEPQFADRFAREAQALARLNHPNIVTVHDFGQAGGFYYLLMEFVDGLNLRQLLRARRLRPAEALAIVPPICEALQYAHDHGIVHRDIKPENLLLDKDGRVRIADFGVAKLVGREADAAGGAGPGALSQGLTQAGSVAGTPQYMAPEQVEHPENVDHRADLYSLGVVFYEMLTGQLPEGKFPLPSRKVQVDVRLDEVVLRSLEKEPERRYQQASQVKTDVETITATPRRAPARRRSLAALLRTVVGVAVLLFAGVWFAMFPKTRDVLRPDFVASVAIGVGLLALGVGALMARKANAVRVALSVALLWAVLYGLVQLSALRAAAKVIMSLTQAEPSARPLTAPADIGPGRASAQSEPPDVAGVPAEERFAGGDRQKRYFLIGKTDAATAPAAGYHLLLVLPGGDGGPDFQPFVRRIWQKALPDGYLIAQLVAPKWDERQFEQLVWPTDTNAYPAMKFSTEAFANAVVADVAKLHRLNSRCFFSLAWSSGGPAAYALSLAPGTRVTGSFIAMSVFKPEQLPPPTAAKGKAYYLLHSPQDIIPLRVAETARDTLAANGATVRLQTYEGGHGWHGDVFGMIKEGIAWLEAQAADRSGLSNPNTER